MINVAETIRLRLESDLPAEEYRRWVAPLKWAYDPDSGALTLSAPTIFHQKRIFEKYAADIRRQAAACGCPLSALKFQVQSPQAPIAPVILNSPAPAFTDVTKGNEKAGTDPAQNFETFLTYPSNRLASLALEKFALGYEALPAKIVFISSSGPWGKTHLLNAAARKLAAGISLLKLDSGEPDEAQWARAEVIVADNVHLLEQRPDLQKRLIMVFDETASRRLRIIASAPASPVKLLGISEQLRSRLSSGLMLKIDPPEFELMKELAGLMARKAGLKAGEDLKTALAQEAQGDPRRLAGVIESAAYIASNTDLDLTEALNAVMMDRSPGRNSEKPAMELIIETVAASFALKPLDLTGHSRLQQTAWPRRTAMYLARELTGLTTSQIGSAFGGRDHSTVIHALKKIGEEIKNPAKARIVENIRRAIIMGEKEAVID